MRVSGQFRRLSVALFTVIAMAAMFCVGCGGDNGTNSGINSGGNDSGTTPGTNPGGVGSYTYTGRTVTIGTQTWMAENLNYDVPGDTTDVCYENIADSCAKYGRLYSWVTAMNGAFSSSSNPSGVRGICPVGWHLPSDAEWTMLTDYLGGSSVAGGKLKSTTGWYNNGTDEVGFSALPGGYGYTNGHFYFGGNNGHGSWWSTTERNTDQALHRYMGSYGMSVEMNYEYKSSRLNSIRCVAD